jgi:CelD/BcsL family acetyltransferase involved in cellulose biosynthesis
MGARLSRASTEIQWKNAWDAECDAALEALPAPAGCTRAQYKALTEPTHVPKRHAIAREGGAVTAIISLRRRRSFWEPVTYQSLPGVIAPAVDDSALGRALAALGVEVRMEAGLDAVPDALNASYSYDYKVYQIELQGDYVAHWKKRNQKHLWAVRRARQRCETATHRLNHPGDLEWIVEQWRQNWADDPSDETVAAPDRTRFWSALAVAAPGENDWRVTTLAILAEDGERAAGTVLLSRRDFVSFQCTARNPAYDTLSAGTRVLDLAIEWSAQQGFKTFDLGGGAFKKGWGKDSAARFGAAFRPKLMSALSRVAPD